MLPEVCIREVESLGCADHRVVGDVLAPAVDTLPAAALVVREPAVCCFRNWTLEGARKLGAREL